MPNARSRKTPPTRRKSTRQKKAPPRTSAKSGPSEPTRRDVRRAQIIDAARVIVAREGLDKLTFASLERAVEFTRGVITYHFENKDAVIHALLEDAVAEIDAGTTARVAEAADLESQCHAAIGGMVDGFLEHPEASQVLLTFWGLVGSDRHAAKVNASLYRRYRKMSRTLIEEATARNRQCQADPEGLATVMVGIVIGIVCQAWFDPKHVDVAAAVAEGGAAVYARLA